MKCRKSNFGFLSTRQFFFFLKVALKWPSEAEFTCPLTIFKRLTHPALNGLGIYPIFIQSIFTITKKFVNSPFNGSVQVMAGEFRHSLNNFGRWIQSMHLPKQIGISMNYDCLHLFIFFFGIKLLSQKNIKLNLPEQSRFEMDLVYYTKKWRIL